MSNFVRLQCYTRINLTYHQLLRTEGPSTYSHVPRITSTGRLGGWEAGGGTKTPELDVSGAFKNDAFLFEQFTIKNVSKDNRKVFRKSRYEKAFIQLTSECSRCFCKRINNADCFTIVALNSVTLEKDGTFQVDGNVKKGGGI